METRTELTAWAVTRDMKDSGPEVLSLWDTHNGAKAELKLLAEKFNERMWFEWLSDDSFTFSNGDEMITMSVKSFPIHSEGKDEDYT